MPDYRPLKNKANNYGFGPDEQKSKTFTGMGMDINVHDQWAVESLGAIQDRTREHLGQMDVGIKRYRRLLKKAIQAESSSDLPFRPGNAASQNFRGPVAIDSLGAPSEPDCWKKLDLERRQQNSWAKDPWQTDKADID